MYLGCGHCWLARHHQQRHETLAEGATEGAETELGGASRFLRGQRKRVSHADILRGEISIHCTGRTYILAI